MFPELSPPTSVARLLFAVPLAVLLSIGCDTTTTVPESQVVVEAYLQGGEPMEAIRLSRTVGIGEPYEGEDNAVRDATVAVHRLADDGTALETVPFREGQPGVYEPTRSLLVHPRATYRLEVAMQDGDELTATTTVPDTLAIVRSTNEEAVYRSEERPSLTVTPSSGPDRQDVFVITTTSLLDFEETPTEELREQLTPLYATDYDPEEDQIESFRVISSTVLNEANYERNADGTRTIDLPWIAVAFFGPNEVGVNVIDDNLYDLLRSQQAQQGGLAPQQGGLSPGEIPNVLEHIEGGTGIFGSYVQDRRQVVIQRPSEGSE